MANSCLSNITMVDNCSQEKKKQKKLNRGFTFNRSLSQRFYVNSFVSVLLQLAIFGPILFLTWRTNENTFVIGFTRFRGIYKACFFSMNQGTKC